MRSLSAMFDSSADADRAVSALKAAGIADVVLTGQENEGYGTRQYSAEARTDRGFFESIGDFFFPEEDRYAYAEGLNRGGYLVTVRNIPENQYETALDILDNEGAVDLDAREAEWRTEGWTGYGAGEVAAAGYAGERSAGMDANLNAEGKIDVVEEQVTVGKRQTEGGRVRVRSYVVETPVEQDVELRSERVHVERRPVDRPADSADFQERSIEASEYAESAVVQKEARVVEEIGLSKDVESHTETVRDTVRKTEVEIEDERGQVVDRNSDLDRR
ncbi:YsnF/AvaK domain-containing protein [Paracoccus sp. MC1862]|nr:YsnF/AvaK domain-containing protein [Paracoccus sp. MC1854]MBB1497363.1 YsnF/AvaK domain-containing protein [Paracoccus sp. MC1862]